MTDYDIWLRDRTIHLDTERSLNSEVDPIVERIYKDLNLPPSNKRSTHERRFKALKCISANLLNGAMINHALRYHRDKNYYASLGYHKDWYTHAIVIPIFDKLIEKKWIIAHRAFYNKQTKQGWISRAYANKKLKSLFREKIVKLTRHLEYSPLDGREIILKPRKSNRIITYQDTPETKSWRKDIKDYNSSTVSITVDNLEEVYSKYLLHTGKVIVYSPSILTKDDLNSLFDRHRNIFNTFILELIFKNYTEDQRHTDKRDLAECDYSRFPLDLFSYLYTQSYSPLLLKNECVHRTFIEDFIHGGRFAGPTYQRFPEELRDYISIDGEPTIERDFKGMMLGILLNKAGVSFNKDPYYRITAGDPNLKKMYKLIGNIAISSSSRGSTTKSLNKQFMKGNLILEGGLRTNEALDEFIKAYPEISHLLFQDLSLELQFIESRIMNRVTRHLLRRKGIFPLLIHDSARVQISHAGDLEQAMEEEYEEVMWIETGQRFKPLIA